MAFLELLLRLWNLSGLSVPAWHFVKLVYVCLLCVAVPVSNTWSFLRTICGRMIGTGLLLLSDSGML
ncbi:MAG: hypothetical protein ACLVGL_03480 [Waltera sp.]